LLGYHQRGDEALQQGIKEYDARAFPNDPFLSPVILQRCAQGPGVAVLDDNDPDICRDESTSDYWAFISNRKSGIAGAVIKQITRELFVVASLHRPRSQRGARFSDVAGSMISVVDSAATALILSAASAADIQNAALSTGCAKGFRDVYKLNEIEAEIVELLLDGALNKQIGFDLALPEYTVENYLRRIYAKVGVKNRSALVSHYYRFTAGN